MSDELVAFITCPPSSGQALAKALLEEKLAACVNILPAVHSLYFWQGQLQNENEELLIVKTTKEVWDQFQRRVKELHSYEVPEIIAIPVVCGYGPYLDWIQSNVLASKHIHSSKKGNG